MQSAIIAKLQEIATICYSRPYIYIYTVKVAHVKLLLVKTSNYFIYTYRLVDLLVSSAPLIITIINIFLLLWLTTKTITPYTVWTMRMYRFVCIYALYRKRKHVTGITDCVYLTRYCYLEKKKIYIYVPTFTLSLTYYFREHRQSWRSIGSVGIISKYRYVQENNDLNMLLKTIESCCISCSLCMLTIIKNFVFNSNWTFTF